MSGRQQKPLKNGTSSDKLLKPAKPGLRMKELVAATGVAKSTILHYVNEGMLPPPVKTSRNMAYYSPACIDRINFIRLMQVKHRLPLAVIKKMCTDLKETQEVVPLVELSTAIFGRQDIDLLDKNAFCTATGLSSGEVADLESAGLLRPLEEAMYDTEDLIIARVLKRCRELGVTPGEAAYYPQLAQQIVDHEMAIRDRLTEGLSLEENATVTLELTKAARALRPYVIDRVFQQRVMSRKSLEDRKQHNLRREE
jgi:DNA-binding transcriptional MerR regulator